MCMIAYKPEGISIPEQYLFNAFMENSDGCGFMYPLKGKLVIEKPFYGYNTFIERYKKVIEDYNNPPVVVHFRLVASGNKSDKNTMPMYIKQDKLGMCHNGVISEFAGWAEKYDNKKMKKMPYIMTTGESDTYRFNEEILKELPRGFLNNEAIIYLMEFMVGTWNKLTFMDYKGRVWFLNKDEGHWHRGVWYSSNSYVTGYYQNMQYYGGGGVYEYPDDKKIEVNMNKEPLMNKCISCKSELKSPLEIYEGICYDCIVEYGVEIYEEEYEDPDILEDIRFMKESGWLPERYKGGE